MRSKVLLCAVFLLPLAATKLLPRAGTKNQNNDWYDDDEDDEVSIASRSTDSEGNSTEVKHVIHNLFARAAGSAHRYDFCIGDAVMIYEAPAYPAGKERFDCEDWEKCENFNVKMVSRSPSSPTDDKRGGGGTSIDTQETKNSKSNEAKRNQIKKPNKKDFFQTEHIVERQLLKQFLNNHLMAVKDASKISPAHRFGPKPNPHNVGKIGDTHCKYFKRKWHKVNRLDVTKGQAHVDDLSVTPLIGGRKPIDWVAFAYPNREDKFSIDEMYDLQWELNAAKALMFGDGASVNSEKKKKKYEKDMKDKHRTPALIEPHMSIMKANILTVRYLKHPKVSKIYSDQVDRIAKRLDEAEDALVYQWKNAHEKYVREDLGKKWKLFMEERTKAAMEEVKAFLEDWASHMTDQVRNYDRREEEAKKKGGKADFTADEKELVKRFKIWNKEVEKFEGFEYKAK